MSGERYRKSPGKKRGELVPLRRGKMPTKTIFFGGGTRVAMAFSHWAIWRRSKRINAAAWRRAIVSV